MEITTVWDSFHNEIGYVWIGLDWILSLQVEQVLKSTKNVLNM